MKKQKKKVVVGMSGGVDSAVTVSLLQKEGYEVEGIFLEFWKGSKSKEDFKFAKKMANVLNVQLSKVSAEKDFRKKVVDEFIKEYENGNTPNPCVICNPRIKFDILLKEMKKRSVDFLATGHYVRQKRKFSIFNFQFSNRLFQARDKVKDQSYFLYRLKPEQLEQTVFPLGNSMKSEVKKIAEKIGLEMADKKESQDVCFVSQNNFNNFLKKYIKNNSGEIQNSSGKVLGEHLGLHFYTIGQRKGIDIGGKGPYFVVKKDIKNNLLIVSNDKEKKKFWKDNFKIKNTNWISKDIEFPLKTKVKVRYHSNVVCATILEIQRNKEHKVENEKKIYEVKLNKAQKAITSGQSAVFYSEDREVLGGGIII